MKINGLNDQFFPILLSLEDVTVWRLSLDLPGTALRRCRAVLSPEERERAARLLRPVHRRRFIACWGQLRWLLSFCLDVLPAKLQFGCGSWGKPYLIGSDLGFNLSHSGDCLVVAMAWKKAVGVDVERIRPLPRMASLARRCFAPREMDAWRTLPAREREEAFFRLWTLKEAFVKAHGQGLGLGAKGCVFTLKPLRLVAVPAGCGRPADWQVATLAAEDPLRMALCVHGGPVRIGQRTLAPDWLSGAQAAAREDVEDRRGAFEASHRAWDEQ